MHKIKIGIVDDHTIVRKGLISVIEEFDEFEVVMEAEHGKQLIDKIESAEILPDILLIDLTMPEMDGFETMAHLKKSHPKLPCIALTGNTDYESVFRSISHGARAYLLKDSELDHLHHTIMEVMTKGKSFGSFAVDKLIDYVEANEEISAIDNSVLKKLHSEFSKVELQFLDLVCSEMNYAQIAEIMHVSTRTIEGYKEALCKKINVKTRIGLVLFAIKNGIYKI